MTLTVILLDDFGSQVAMVHLNQSRAFARRTVQIHLTPEQAEALRPRRLGAIHGREVFEEIEQCWIEEIEEKPR